MTQRIATVTVRFRINGGDLQSVSYQARYEDVVTKTNEELIQPVRDFVVDNLKIPHSTLNLPVPELSDFSVSWSE